MEMYGNSQFFSAYVHSTLKYFIKIQFVSFQFKPRSSAPLQCSLNWHCNLCYCSEDHKLVIILLFQVIPCRTFQLKHTVTSSVHPDTSWSARMHNIPRCKEGHRHAALLTAEVKGLTGHCIQRIFMHLCLDKSHPGPFTTSPPLIPTYVSHWVALLKCWKGHRNMPPLRICSASDTGFEFHMHQWVISFVVFLWVIRKEIQRESVWPPHCVTTFAFHSKAFYFLRGLIHC